MQTLSQLIKLLAIAGAVVGSVLPVHGIIPLVDVYDTLNGYNAAVMGQTVLGAEDFESIFNPATMHPVVPGFYDLSARNGNVFNTGLGLTITANSGLLALVSSAYGMDANSWSVWEAGTADSTPSLTLTFAPSSGAPVTGVSMNVLSYLGTPASGTVHFLVFDQNQDMIAMGTVSNSTMDSASGQLGIVAGPGLSIGRILLVADFVEGWFVGVDNISAVTTASPVPEPSIWAAAVGGFALTFALWRRRRQ